ncbi:MAG: membrane lipoprotein lipid attachment site-containing protein [Terricaulis sp.]
MKRFLFALGCLFALSACATGYYGGADYSYYDGYYDNYYGPVAYGYWGPDDYFYYRTGVSTVYVRDDARHFHREAGPGWRHFHMRGQRPH